MVSKTAPSLCFDRKRLFWPIIAQNNILLQIRQYRAVFEDNPKNVSYPWPLKECHWCYHLHSTITSKFKMAAIWDLTLFHEALYTLVGATKLRVILILVEKCGLFTESCFDWFHVYEMLWNDHLLQGLFYRNWPFLCTLNAAGGVIPPRTIFFGFWHVRGDL